MHKKEGSNKSVKDYAWEAKIIRLKIIQRLYVDVQKHSRNEKLSYTVGDH